MPVLRILPDTLVNQIAAGEVIERPAAALKELVENALDAGSTAIDIVIKNGGKTYLCVTDNGCGMSREDLSLAITRHATSKMPSDDLVHIESMGFRGEALPSIGAVSRLTLTSRQPDADTAWAITVEGGKILTTIPAAHPTGSRVEVRDLFYATPARLKFLKADATEYAACKDVVIRLALARPDVAFSLTHNDQRVLHVATTTGTTDAQLASRVRAIMGVEFHDQTVPVHADDHTVRITGRIGNPTFHKGQSNHQYLFVNNRPVKDRIILGALRAAFSDIIPHDRHGVALLFITLPAEDVDVNVHPAKAEVRFRDSARVRSMLIAAIRARLSTGHSAAAHVMAATASSAPWSLSHNLSVSNTNQNAGYQYSYHNNHTPSHHIPSAKFSDSAYAAYAPLFPHEPSLRPVTEQVTNHISTTYPLGIARTHIHNMFIISQTQDGMVIVDAHAAHERLMYEKYKRNLNDTGIPTQRLLSPEIITLDDVRAIALLDHAATLYTHGLEVEQFGPDCLMVRSVPSEISDRLDLPRLMSDLADEILETGSTQTLSDRILSFLATKACHHAVRAGRPLNMDEMNALLRQMEEMPSACTCNHGRPTFFKMVLTDIEKLFERR